LRLLWVTALVAPLAAGCGLLLSAYFYARLNADGSWSAERASLWSGVAFAFFCVFGAVSLVAIVLLVRRYNSFPRLPDRDEVNNP
jgi:hypothetical protein